MDMSWRGWVELRLSFAVGRNKKAERERGSESLQVAVSWQVAHCTHANPANPANLRGIAISTPRKTFSIGRPREAARIIMAEEEERRRNGIIIVPDEAGE